MPRVKIRDLLLEVDQWTDFTRHFTHLKSDSEPSDRTLLLTALLADAFNLGLEKMADACPGTSVAKLSWLVAWYIRDETYQKGLAELVNSSTVAMALRAMKRHVNFICNPDKLELKIRIDFFHNSNRPARSRHIASLPPVRAGVKPATSC